MDLPHDGKEIRRVQPPRLLVEAACGAEVGEPELAARILDAVAQDVEGASPLDFGGESLEELLLHGRAMVLFELPPLPWLRGEGEVHHVAGQQAERAVVVVRVALAVAARWRVAVGRRCLADGDGITRAGIRAVLEQAALDRRLECALGDLGAHRGSVPSESTCRQAS